MTTEPTMTSRQQKAILTKIKITNAAKIVAKTKGVNNFNVKEICEEAGVSVGGFYHHFSSLEYLVEESFKYDNQIESVLKSNPLNGTAYEQIQALFYHQMSFIENYGVPMMTLLYRNYISHQENGSDHYMLEHRLMPTTLREIIQLGQRQQQISSEISSYDMSNGLLYLTRGIIFSWTLSNASFDIKSTTNQCVHGYLQGKLLVNL